MPTIHQFSAYDFQESVTERNIPDQVGSRQIKSTSVDSYKLINEYIKSIREDQICQNPYQEFAAERYCNE